MTQINILKRIALLLLLLISTAVAYWPGLSGGFYFDDYPNIIHNRGIELATLDFDGLRRAAFSSNAGPLQRPIPMVSFAINHHFSGTNPLDYKITNLAIHMANTGLVFIFTLLLARQASRKSTNAHSSSKNWLIALFVAAFWGLHPVNLTSVLYVVQRMNSLAGTFSLLALIGFLYARPHLHKGLRWLVLLLVSFISFGLMAVYSKENAFLLPVFALLLEYTLFKSAAETPRYWQFARRLGLLILIAVTGWWLIQHLLLSNWATQAYLPRPFTMKERLLTEVRILWQYWAFILLPNIRDMGLYLDDFPISTNLLNPITTLPALLGHVAVIVIALLNLKTRPIASLGLLWFYVGHTLESTLFPLELMYEHRNYIPMIGPVFALTYYGAAGLSISSQKLRRVLLPCCVVLIILLGSMTSNRSFQFGDAWGFPFFEAKNHPYSTRSNFFAGKICGELMTKFPDKKDQYFKCAVHYMTRSIQVNPYVTEPLIALAQIHVNARYRIPENVINELGDRLKNQALGNDGAYLAKGLLELGLVKNEFIKDESVNTLFLAGISNTSLHSTNRAHFLVSYGLFLCDVVNKCEDGLNYFKEATEISSSPQFPIILATYQLRMGKRNELQKTIELAELRDKYGYFKDNIRSLNKNRMLYFQSTIQ